MDIVRSDFRIHMPSAGRRMNDQGDPAMEAWVPFRVAGRTSPLP